MTIRYEHLDSRRLTGPNLLWNRAGAILDIGVTPFDEATCRRAIDAWKQRCSQVLDQLGWREEFSSRIHPGGFSVALSAPMDAVGASAAASIASVRQSCIVWRTRTWSGISIGPATFS